LKAHRKLQRAIAQNVLVIAAETVEDVAAGLAEAAAGGIVVATADAVVEAATVVVAAEGDVKLGNPHLLKPRQGRHFFLQTSRDESRGFLLLPASITLVIWSHVRSHVWWG
jgi:glycine/D-amino acid oxidase-like deaminating enzyme